ncbi:MAG: DMT family transporter [Mailhella sp.]|nr:DMT family transporter [Mailhella sp.]
MYSHRENNTKFIVGCLCAIGCAILYGLSFVFTKNVIGSVTTLSLLGWRFFVAFAVFNLCVILGIIKINIKKKLKPVLILSLFFPVLYFIGETIGVYYTTASESGVFIASIPVATLVASSLLLHNYPTRLQLVGISVTFFGVLITVLSVGMKSHFSGIGYTFLLIAVLSYSLYCVFVEKASEFSGAEITYVMLACGAAVYAFLAIAESYITDSFNELLTLPLTNSSFLSAILYQGIGCSICAFFMSNVAISTIGINRTSSFIGLDTIVSISSGVLVLNEIFTPYQVIGSAVIILGVYIANMKRKRYRSA